MTVNANNNLIGKMTTLLSKSGISAQDCELAERYLKGEAGDEVLDQFKRKDLSGVSRQISDEAKDITDQIRKVKGKEKKEVCVRFFNVVYAIGHGSCHSLFWYNAMDHAEEYELYKRMIVYISIRIDYPGWLDQGDYSHLLQMVQYKPANMLEVLPMLREEGELYAAVILAMYFGRKYETPGEVSAEDAALIKEYEDIVLKNFDEWLAAQGCPTHEETIAAIRGKRPAGNIVGRMEFVNINGKEKSRFYFITSLAYLNFQLSGVLTEMVRTCAAVNAEETLHSFLNVYIGGGGARTDIAFKGGDFEEVFHIDPELYIGWAAWSHYDQILKRQLEKNQESYLKVMELDKCRELIYICKQSWGPAANSRFVNEEADNAINQLKDVLQKEKPELYQQVVQKAKPDHERMIGYLVEPTPHAELAKEYLRGNCKVSELYPYDEEFGDHFQSGPYATRFYDAKKLIQKYQKHCNDEAFLNRCRVFLIFKQIVGLDLIFEKSCSSVENVKKFFALLDKEQLDIKHQLWAFVLLYKEYARYDRELGRLMEGAEEIFTGYMNEYREEMIKAFIGLPSEGRFFALHLLRKDTVKNKREILNYAKDSSNLVMREMLDILYGQKDWEDDIKVLLNGKKASERELAIRVLLRWQQEGGNYNVLLSQALETEKSAKLVTLLQKALDIQGGGQADKPLSKEELVKQIHKGGKKGAVAWAYETPFSVVHKIDGEVASDEYIQAIFLCYAAQIIRGFDKNAQLLAADLNAPEFAVYVNELFDKWIAQGAEAKKGWVLFAASIHGNEDMVPKLYHQIQEWPKTSRGLIAAEAVRALALNPSPRALLLVDSIARKFKHKQVKDGAVRALNEAAKQLGISREELDDRIVPDLGFDDKQQRTFDYGERVFKVMLTPLLDIEVYDENGKKLKNLPAPGKKDDESKAPAAYAEFKEMKKQMKAAVTSQKTRLEYALSAKREWSPDAWKKLFVKNPLMHQFAIGLIWGVYENGELVQSFRYMEDGSFNTQDEEEYALPAHACISLVHPVELTDEEKEAWKEQLADYEIKQPIEQLERAVYPMTEEEADQRYLDRFGGCIVNDLSLNGKLTGLGWYRGSVEDAGSYNTYYREDAETGMGVRLHFSGSFVGWHQEDVTVYEVAFYKAGTAECRAYAYGDDNRKKACLLRDVSPRYFSEIVLQLAKVTASSEERDEGWRKEAGL
ncbi:MAG: DUF4132 domain-containing protein [Lachnospiraceae bacterium]|nr:DUF4132 domain-containing protein [Lachnospiraceae bacterium]